MAECPSGKRSYDSIGQAKGQMRWMQKKGKVGETIHAYHCEICHSFHIGNSSRPLKRRG